jgi:hypothetical protein
MEQRQIEVLNKLGLQPHMVWKGTSVYDEELFEKYVSEEYKNSRRFETDEFYSMFENILLHKSSGLRVRLTSTESYDGERVDYKVIGLFIITLDNRNLNVLDADFDQKVFVTPEQIISFSLINKKPE